MLLFLHFVSSRVRYSPFLRAYALSLSSLSSFLFVVLRIWNFPVGHSFASRICLSLHFCLRVPPPHLVFFLFSFLHLQTHVVTFCDILFLLYGFVVVWDCTHMMAFRIWRPHPPPRACATCVVHYSIGDNGAVLCNPPSHYIPLYSLPPINISPSPTCGSVHSLFSSSQIIRKSLTFLSMPGQTWFPLLPSPF